MECSWIVKHFWGVYSVKETALFHAGLQTSQNGKFYAVSTKFDKFSTEGKTLVVQFTVKHEQKIDCGGGYVKVCLPFHPAVLFLVACSTVWTTVVHCAMFP